MDIQLKINELSKEIENLESRISADSANLKELKRALKSFQRIEESAKAIKVPVTTEKK